MSGAQWGGWSKQYKSALFWGATLPLLIALLLPFTNCLSLLLLSVCTLYKFIESLRTLKAITCHQKTGLFMPFFACYLNFLNHRVYLLISVLK